VRRLADVGRIELVESWRRRVERDADAILIAGRRGIADLEEQLAGVDPFGLRRECCTVPEARTEVRRGTRKDRRRAWEVWREQPAAGEARRKAGAVGGKVGERRRKAGEVRGEPARSAGRPATRVGRPARCAESR
jgi:hypothetical protein